MGGIKYMSKRSHRNNNFSNVNVTTYSGFSKLRLISTLLRITMFLLIVAFPVVWYDISTEEIAQFFGIVLTISLVANIIAVIVVNILRHAYRV